MTPSNERNVVTVSFIITPLGINCGASYDSPANNPYRCFINRPPGAASPVPRSSVSPEGLASAEKALRAVIVEAYVKGLSTRVVDDLVRALGIGHVRWRCEPCTI